MKTVITAFAIENLKVSLNNYFTGVGKLKVGTGNIYAEFIAQVEYELIFSALKAYGFNKSKTAAALGINRWTLSKKIKIYGITKAVDDFKNYKVTNIKQKFSEAEIVEDLGGETI